MDIRGETYELTTKVVSCFRDFLNSSWSSLENVLNDHDWDNDPYFVEDWFDENWSLFVSRQILGKKGGLQPFSAAENEVLKENFKYQLESVKDRKIFVSLGTGNDSFQLRPPFDKMKMMNEDGTIEIVSWKSSKLRLRCNAVAEDSN